MSKRISTRSIIHTSLVFALLLSAGWLVTKTTVDAKTVARQQQTASAIHQKPVVVQPARSLFVARRFQQPAASGEQTIGQEQKNIKVLNGLPQSQLIPMMNFMAASLGVRCNYCHVNKAGQWDYALDEKPEKNTAREMITMVFAMNKANFKGNPQVSCYTCHRSRTTPQGVPTLPIPEPPARGNQGGPGPGGPGATPSPGAAAPPAAPALPTADDILNKYVTAIGGQAAVDKLKTRVLKGTYAAANGQTATFEIDQSGPDKFHIIFTTPQASMERGFDGSTGWEKNPRGVSVLGGDQLADMKRMYTLFSDLKLKEQFTRLNVRKDKLDGRDVWVINAITTDRKRERLYFDAETGLLLRRANGTQTPVGLIPQEVNFEDYRDVDGVKVPFTIRVVSIDQGSTSTRKYTEVKFNGAVDDASFNKPAGPPPGPRP